MDTFQDLLESLNWDELTDQIENKTSKQVEEALHKSNRNMEDFKALVSPAAEPYLEDMARISQQRTLKRFGKTMQLYIPLYLANYCDNACIYCGFNHNNKINRKKLKPEELEKEVAVIKNYGFHHILLLTGESSQTSAEYLKEAVKVVKPHFSQISLEVPPMNQQEYEELIAEGVNSVYLYQETYHRQHYTSYHLHGPKADFAKRLNTYEALGRAGMYKIGLGVLLGLENWRVDSFFVALHLKYLEQKYWRSKYSISFPRLRPHEGQFQPNYPVEDKHLLQLICAYRLLDEDVEIALSTRERPVFRDNALPLGVTCMSSGSSTEPGGYSQPDHQLKQFETSDDRSTDEIIQMIRKKGYQPVWKDWELCLQE